MLFQLVTLYTWQSQLPISGVKESLLVLILENVKTSSSQYFYWQMKAQQLFVEFTQNFYNHMIYINKYLFGF